MRTHPVKMHMYLPLKGAGEGFLPVHSWRRACRRPLLHLNLLLWQRAHSAGRRRDDRFMPLPPDRQRPWKMFKHNISGSDTFTVFSQQTTGIPLNAFQVTENVTVTVRRYPRRERHRRRLCTGGAGRHTGPTRRRPVPSEPFFSVPDPTPMPPAFYGPHPVFA